MRCEGHATRCALLRQAPAELAQDREEFLTFFEQPAVQHRGASVFALFSGASFARCPTDSPDHVRILLLARYGGMWLDNDVYLVRDLTPLLRVGPFVGSVEREMITSNSAPSGCDAVD